LPESFPWLKLYWLQDLPLIGTGRLGKLFVLNWEEIEGLIFTWAGIKLKLNKVVHPPLSKL